MLIMKQEHIFYQEKHTIFKGNSKCLKTYLEEIIKKKIEKVDLLKKSISLNL